VDRKIGAEGEKQNFGMKPLHFGIFAALQNSD